MLTILVHRMSRSLVLIHQSLVICLTAQLPYGSFDQMQNRLLLASLSTYHAGRERPHSSSPMWCATSVLHASIILSLSHASVSRRSLSSSLRFRAGIQDLATTVCEDSGDESTTRICRRTPTVDGVGVIGFALDVAAGVRGVDGELLTVPVLFLTRFTTGVFGVGTGRGDPWLLDGLMWSW